MLQAEGCTQVGLGSLDQEGVVLLRVYIRAYIQIAKSRTREHKRDLQQGRHALRVHSEVRFSLQARTLVTSP